MGSFPSMLDTALRGLSRQRLAPLDGYARSPSSAPTSRSAFDPVNTNGQAAELARMVESEIIPRLMLAHDSTRDEAAAADQPPGLNLDSADAFARMVLSKEAESLLAYVGALLQSGLSMESVYVDLMIPAARRLGDYWEDDSISFADVTIGLGRLQQVVRTLGWRPSDVMGSSHSAPSALFVPATTEQHTFGLFIIEDFFRRAGWRTWIETSAQHKDVLDMVKLDWFDILGFSANGDANIDALTATIAAVRRASKNPGLLIMVGGRLFIERPELVARVGADATASTGGDALLIADRALKRLAASA